MFTRLFGVLSLVAVLGLAVLATPAFAVEDDEGTGPAVPYDKPSIDEVVTDSEASRQFLPEEAERQPFMDEFIFPLLILGVIIILVVGVLYLKWQPDFDRQSGKR